VRSIPLRDTPSTYGFVSRLLHALVAGLMLANWLLGMIGGEDGEGGALAELHASLGLLALPLALFWILWRLVNPKPRIPGDGTLLRGLAHFTHAGLMALALLLPASGLADTLAAGRPVRFFGLELVPARSVAGQRMMLREWAEGDEEEWEEAFGEGPEEAGESLWGELHATLAAPVFVLFFALHLLGVLKQQLWDRRPVMRRIFAAP